MEVAELARLVALGNSCHCLVLEAVGLGWLYYLCDLPLMAA